MFTFGDGTKDFHGLAWDGEYLWGLIPAEDVVIKIDPETGFSVHSVPCPGKIQKGLAWGSGFLWVNDRALDGSIYSFAPEDGTVFAVLDTGMSGNYWPGGLAFEPPEGNGE
jgi:hypothetical protein